MVFLLAIEIVAVFVGLHLQYKVDNVENNNNQNGRILQ